MPANNHGSENIPTFAPQTLCHMIKKFVLSILWLLPMLCMSQDPVNPYKFSLSGYVRADAIFDSRQAVEAREGYLMFYPKKPVYDKEGNDINAQPSFNQYAMTTRLTGKITGPDILGAKAFALIESDFTGASNAENNSLRLRHAYISLQWKTTRLMAGQYWHPQDIPEMIPNVLALNTGAPFHSFSRQPQVRIDQKLGNFNLVAVAASQRDYVNTGPGGNSPSYLRNSVIPNLHSQLQYKKEQLFLGASVDYKNLTPRLITDSAYISNESVICLSYSAFGSLKVKHLTLKTQYTLNRALNDHLMMGGFAVTGMDASTGRFQYMPLSYHSVWINMTYNMNKWQPSFFAGYTSNATDEAEITGAVYARDPDIDYVYRIAPMITFTERNFSFHCELEYTAAAYEYDKTSLILLKKYETALFRVNLAAVYSF